MTLPGSLRNYVLILLLILAAPAGQRVRASVIASQLPPGPAPAPFGGGDSYNAVATPNGRYVIFASTANNLVAGSNNAVLLDYFPAHMNVFLRDRQMGTTLLASMNAAGTGGGNDDSWPDAVSADGRYVLFESAASDLVPNDTNGAKDIFLRDTVNGTTALVSVSTNGYSGNGESREATMTPDAHFVAFVSAATNLVAQDTNGIPDIFVRDMQAGTTVLASPGANAVASSATTPFTPGSSSEFPILSVDGRYAAFYSTATNLVTNGPTHGEVYVRDLSNNITIWASSNAHSHITSPGSANYAISTNGQYVAYQSTGTTPAGMVFRYNLSNGVTDIIATNGGVDAVLDVYERNIDISADGRFVAFTMTNGSPGSEVLLWDGQSNMTSLVSGGTVGAQCDVPRLDQSGRYVAFSDNESALTTNSDGSCHIFVRDTMTSAIQMADVWTNGLGYAANMTPFFLSASGGVLAFDSFDGTNSVSPYKMDVFARDLVAGASEVISTPLAALASTTGYGSSRLSPYSLSSNGQYVAFSSDAPNLAGIPANNSANIYVHDFGSGSNTLASVSAAGSAPSSTSYEAAISADGRYVAFSSYATNLVINAAPTAEQIYLRDLQAAATVMVSVDLTGSIPGNDASSAPQISADGRYVLFCSVATNLVTGGTGGYFWRDLQAGATWQIAACSTNIAAMTPDGSNVLIGAGTSLELWQAQTKSSTTILTAAGVINDVAIGPDATRGAYGTGTAIFIADLIQHTSTQLGLAKPASHTRMQFSGDSQWLVNLVQDSYSTNQVYLYSFAGATNTLISQAYSSAGGANNSCDSVTISSTGRYMAYRSAATNLVPGNTNGIPNIFLYDRLSGATTLISVSSRGNQAANSRSLTPVFSGDGQTLFFESWATDVGANDFNQCSDIFALALSSAGVGVSTNNPPPLAFSGLNFATINGQAASVLTWNSALPGAGYQVQFKNDLADPLWQNLTEPATVVGSQGQIIDLAPNGTQRFYRIESY